MAPQLYWRHFTLSQCKQRFCSSASKETSIPGDNGGHDSFLLVDREWMLRQMSVNLSRRLLADLLQPETALLGCSSAFPSEKHHVDFSDLLWPRTSWCPPGAGTTSNGAGSRRKRVKSDQVSASDIPTRNSSIMDSRFNKFPQVNTNKSFRELTLTLTLGEETLTGWCKGVVWCVFVWIFLAADPLRWSVSALATS